MNFITKENLRGFDVSADFEQIEDSDGDYSVSGAFGWGNDRSSALFAVGYQHRSELFVRDRDWAAKDYLENPQGGWSASGNPHLVHSAVGDHGHAGRRRYDRDPQCAPLGGFPGATATDAPVCYWQYSVYDALTEEEDRWQVYADYNLDITDSTSFHVEAMYADTDIPIYRTSPSYAALQAPTSIATGGTSVANGQYFVPATNPGFAPFVAANPGVFPATTGIGALLIANRPFALGGNPLFGSDSSEGPRNLRRLPRVGRIERRHLGLVVVGCRRDLHGAERDSARVAIRSSIATSWRCAASAARTATLPRNTPGANGCFWYNPFNNAIPAQSESPARRTRSSTPASPTTIAELINWMFPVVSTDQQTTIMVLDAVLSGTTGIDLPGGSLGMGGRPAVSRRHVRSDVQRPQQLRGHAVREFGDDRHRRTGRLHSRRSSPRRPARCCSSAAPANRDLDRDVSAVFAELSLPITDSFQAQLAARYEDYGGGIGSTFDPKLSLRWQLVDSFALRGSVGTTFRGPALQQTRPEQRHEPAERGRHVPRDPHFRRPEPQARERVRRSTSACCSRRAASTRSVDYWSFDFEERARQRAGRRHHELRVRHGRHVRRRPGQSAGGPLRLPRRQQ